MLILHDSLKNRTVISNADLVDTGRELNCSCGHRNDSSGSVEGWQFLSE
jgi:hypothetical protein